MFQAPPWALAWGLFSLLVVVGAYAPHFAGEFVWDDKVYLLENPRLAPGTGIVSVLKAPLSGEVFRPVSTATLWLQVHLFGFSMAGLRATQLALHLGCGLALLIWLRRRLQSLAGAMLGAALFLVHPAATEVVMLANARHDLLGTLFALVTLIVVDDGRSLRRGMAGGLCVLLATGCKESYVILAPLLAAQAAVLYPRLGGGESVEPPLSWRIGVAGGPAALGSAMVFAVRHALGISASSALTLDVVSLARAFAALLAHHVAAFVEFSDGPTAERYVPLAPWLTASILVLSAATLVALTTAAWRGGARARTAWLGTMTLLLGLLPSVAAIPATGQYGNRYGYFALAGFATLVAAAAAPIVPWLATRSALIRRLSMAVLVAAMLVLALETSARAGDWRDGLTLFASDIQRTPSDSRANYDYGVEIVAARGCAEALPYFEHAAEAEPEWARPLRNWAACALRLGRAAEAVGPARRAVELEPEEPAHRRNLAAALLGTGRLDAARAELAEAERLAPGAPQNEALRRTFP
jgi:hypothetical protein